MNTEAKIRRCKSCGEEKPIPKFKQRCVDCSSKQGGEGVETAPKAKKKRKAKRVAEATPVEDPSSFSLPCSLGFTALFENGDFTITQNNGGTEVSIVLTPAELEQLHAWAQSQQASE